jgi:2Fe-2S ferredoxin
VNERPFAVRVLPSGIVMVVEPGESLLVAAQRQSLTWPTLCGGEASCRTCYVVVEEGAEHLPPPAELEQRGIDDLARVVRSGEIRLACQAVPFGDLTVTRRGVRRTAAVTQTGEAL